MVHFESYHGFSGLAQKPVPDGGGSHPEGFEPIPSAQRRAGRRRESSGAGSRVCHDRRDVAPAAASPQSSTRLGLVASAVVDDCNLVADGGEARERDSLHRGDRRVHDETVASGQVAGFGGAPSAVLEQAVADQGATAGQPDAAAGTLTPSCAD